MSAIVPVNVIVASPAPVPLENVRPVVPLSERVPCAAVSVICNGLLPAAGSETETALPPPEENTSESFSLTV